MTAIKEAASEFLSERRVAVTGVSRSSENHGSNVVYKRLRDRGYQVFAVNPNADEVESDPAYHDLGSIPGGVDAVVIGTRAEIADETMRECASYRDAFDYAENGIAKNARAISRIEIRDAFGRDSLETIWGSSWPC